MFNLSEVFREIVARLEEEGAFSREAYDDLVEEVIEEKLEQGELSDDNDTPLYIERLKARWPEVEEMLQTGHDRHILDQE